MKSNNKKGQMEVFGLAVIVILITVGLFFVVKFKMNEKPVQYQKEYILDQGATNFVISILDVGVDECDQTYKLSELLKDCASHRNNIECRGYDSCQLSNKTISTILNRTFVEWNYKFRFYTQELGWEEGIRKEINSNIYTGEIYFNNLNCSDTDEKGQTGTAYIPLYPGTIFLNLELCKQ